MTVKVSAIVEGDGEVHALPILLRRIAQWLTPECPVQILMPIRKALAPVIAFLQFVALNHGAHGAVQNQNPLLYRLLESLKSLCAWGIGYHDCRFPSCYEAGNLNML